MHNQLIDFINKENLVAQGEKVLLAVSGGIDSVLMCQLFSLAGFPFAMAHCNFKLRGKESDGDAQLVESLAKKLSVPFHLKICDAAAYAKEKKCSIQMAARDLRFAWFEELCKTNDYAVYATAHHIDDAIETFFINQLRGTGIAGLHGIKPKNGKLIHPLLFTNRKQITDYVRENNLVFREDSSNKKIKYLRNRLRQSLMPVLEEIQPSYRETFMQNMQRFQAAESVYLQKIEEERQKIFRLEKENVVLSIAVLNNLSNPETYLYEFLKPFGFCFPATQEILAAISNKSIGAQFYANGYVLLVDRENLILTKKQAPAVKEFLIETETGELIEPLQLKWDVLNFFELEKNPNIALLDFEKLHFPLEIRKWKMGDVFFPLGMTGKKHLSDFFIDLKLNRFQKENTWLLVSEKEIVWIISLRIDNRFKVTENTKKVLRIEC
jgi:tRNA(Ile)-lysidine synthase